MLIRTFEYTGYDGKPRKHEWCFNLDESELYKLELGNVGGINGLMSRLMREERPGEIVDMFEKIILGSVGEVSADGERFEKKDGLCAKYFKETKAYSQLFMELVSSGEALANFLRHTIPEEVLEKIEENEKAEKEKAEAAEVQAKLGDGKPELSAVH